MSLLRRIDRIQRRADYLADRLVAADASEGVLGHWRAEHQALVWAIPILTDLAERRATEARDPERQRIEAGFRYLARQAMTVLAECNPDAHQLLLDKAQPEAAKYVSAPRPEFRYGRPVPPADDTRPVAR